MKKHFFFLLVLFSLLTVNLKANSFYSDSSVKITHVIDGLINEWVPEKFENDKETMLQYAIDHDKQNIYLAMRIPDQPTQMKLMTLGMNLYIDKKGKKREATGIEFPLKKEGNSFRGGNRPPQGEASEMPDPKEIRERLAQTMILLKTFGMEDQEDKQQLIIMENGVNIAFDWDENNALFIEYQVPLKFIGNEAALNGKPLGIGWVIHGVEVSNAGSPSVPSAGPSRGGIGRGVVNTNSSRGGPPQVSNNDNRMKEQSYWTKYTIN